MYHISVNYCIAGMDRGGSTAPISNTQPATTGACENVESRLEDKVSWTPRDDRVGGRRRRIEECLDSSLTPEAKMGSPISIGDLISGAEGNNSKKTKREKTAGDTTDDATSNSEQPVLNKMKFPFPWKLYTLLEDAKKQKKEDIVSWDPDGKSFKVHKKREFSEQIMATYFRQTKFESFTRQVSMVMKDIVLEPWDKCSFHRSIVRIFISSSTQICFSLCPQTHL